MSSDFCIRAVAADDQIRAFAAVTKDMTEEARARHNTSPVATAALGRLLSAGAMMGTMMKGDKDLLTLQVRGDGPLKGLTVTADSHGNVKGYPVNPQVLIHAKPNGKLNVGGAVGRGTLTVIRDLGMKEPYSGQVELQTGEIAEDLTYYFAVSEQIPSAVGLGVLMNRENTVRQAGGFIIQLMPFALEETITRLEKNLQDIPSVTTMLDQGCGPEDVLRRVLDGFDLTITRKQAVRFSCSCSRERVRKALISIGRKELESIIRDGKETELRCHFCNTAYHFPIDEIKTLLKECR